MKSKYREANLNNF